METQKEKSKLLKPLLTLLVGILLIAGTGLGVWYWQQNELKKQRADADSRVAELQKQIDELRNSTEKTESADETESWKTYTSNADGFSIKYPESLTVKNYSATGSTEASHNFSPSSATGTNMQSGMINIRVNKSQWSTVKEFAHWAEGRIITEKETIIDNQKAYVVVSTSNGSTVQTYFIIKSGIAYRISFTQIGYSRVDGEVNNTKYQTTFDKMVKTFKFNN